MFVDLNPDVGLVRFVQLVPTPQSLVRFAPRSCSDVLRCLADDLASIKSIELCFVVRTCDVSTFQAPLDADTFQQEVLSALGVGGGGVSGVEEEEDDGDTAVATTTATWHVHVYGLAVELEWLQTLGL